MTDLAIKSFRNAIELWPTREALALEIQATAPQVSKWWQRDFIPADWWSAILSRPVAIEAGLSAVTFARLAESRRLEAAS